MTVVNVYSIGPICCSACAPGQLSSDEVAREVNGSYPTGISSQWRVSGDELFADGEHTNPCACEQDPERKHWLLEC